MQEDIRNQPAKKAMYKEVDGKLIIIAKNKKGMPIIIEQKV